MFPFGPGRNRKRSLGRKGLIRRNSQNSDEKWTFKSQVSKSQVFTWELCEIFQNSYSVE